MTNNDSSSEQDEQSSIEFGLQLQLIASIIGIISQSLSILAILDAIEESKVALKKEKQYQSKFDEQLRSLQLQIDQLTTELAALKSTNQ